MLFARQPLLAALFSTAQGYMSVSCVCDPGLHQSVCGPRHVFPDDEWGQALPTEEKTGDHQRLQGATRSVQQTPVNHKHKASVVSTRAHSNFKCRRIRCSAKQMLCYLIKKCALIFSLLLTVMPPSPHDSFFYSPRADKEGVVPGWEDQGHR